MFMDIMSCSELNTGCNPVCLSVYKMFKEYSCISACWSESVVLETFIYMDNCSVMCIYLISSMFVVLETLMNVCGIWKMYWAKQKYLYSAQKCLWTSMILWYWRRKLIWSGVCLWRSKCLWKSVVFQGRCWPDEKYVNYFQNIFQHISMIFVYVKCT